MLLKFQEDHHYQTLVIEKITSSYLVKAALYSKKLNARGKTGGGSCALP
jgi:hypothetical protein